MTTIRRITVSQIDGNNANVNDTGEIRPFGETGFYLDTDQNPSALTLMMFNGVRTHLRSKVLSPGMLYGSNEDSADGAGYDTIKLIPDSLVYYNGSNQYIVIDPTAPNHIHVRAGGTIDQSTADLFLGGEWNHVKVSDSNDNVVISTDVDGAGATKNWTFGNDGTLTAPGEVYGQFFSLRGGNLSGTIGSLGYEGDIPTLDGTLGVRIRTGAPESGPGWEFTANGSISFPDSTMQDTAWAGGKVVSPPLTSIGVAGDTIGDISFNASYFYYCKANYDGIDNIWKRVAWSNDTW